MNQHIERLTQLREQATFDVLDLMFITSDGGRYHSVQYVNRPAQQIPMIRSCIEQGFIRVNDKIELNPNHITTITNMKKRDTVFIGSEGMAELERRGYTGQKIILSQDEYKHIKQYIKKNTLYENDDL